MCMRADMCIYIYVHIYVCNVCVCVCESLCVRIQVRDFIGKPHFQINPVEFDYIAVA